MQKLLLVGASDGMENAARPHLYVEWESPGLDLDRYQRALNTVLERHLDALVTVTGDLMLQRITEYRPVEIGVTDLAGAGPAATGRAMQRIRDEMTARPLPFGTWPWLEFRATRYGGGCVRLHLSFSNFFLDLVSGTALLHEVESAYAEPPAGPPAPAPGPTLRDAVLALGETERGPLGERARAYWMSRLDTLPEPPALPRGRAPAGAGRAGGLRRRQAELPEADWKAIKEQAGQRALTPTAVLLAVWAEVISQWSGSRHFLLTSLMTRRLIRDTAHVIGNFSAVYPLEVDWRGDGSFADRTRVLQRRLMRDLAHTHCAGFEVLQALSRVRGAQGSAVCPFVVAAGLAAGPQQRMGFSQLETPQALIDHQFWELTDGSLWAVWDVREPAFPPGLLDEMSAAYQELLGRLARDAAAWESAAGALVSPDRAAGGRPAAAETTELPRGLLHDVIQDRDGTAVIAADATLTFAGLRGAAQLLAGRLREAGVGPGDRVAVILPKSAGQITAVHAALTAGAAYVPMDPAWPARRLRTLLSDAQATVAVTDLDLPGITCVRPVTRAPFSRARDGAARDHAGLAYVIYTSGSTGQPKGVVLDHLGPLNTIADVNRRFGVTAADVVLGVSALTFDLSVYDIFCGATLVLPGPADSTAQAWLGLLQRHRVTVWNSAPALMRLLVEAAEAAGVRLPGLRLVLLSGDWIPVTLPGRIRRIAPDAEVVSLGGATEASIWSIYHRIGAVQESWTSIPYGRPLANQPWFILDEAGRPLPTWVTGHLYIGGPGLAREYLGDPAKTAAAFVRHPATGQRIYRTGDLGRYLPDGEIELIGRADQQVKIQGYRIEPGEIEHALTADPRVRDAVVLAHDGPAGKRLLACVTVHGDGDGAAARARSAPSLRPPSPPSSRPTWSRPGSSSWTGSRSPATASSTGPPCWPWLTRPRRAARPGARWPARQYPRAPPPRRPWPASGPRSWARPGSASPTTSSRWAARRSPPSRSSPGSGERSASPRRSRRC